MRTEREEAARRYRPDATKILFVAEAPPTALERYFYFPDVKQQDTLWVQLMRALYGDAFGTTKTERTRKAEWLSRFQADGYQLIDAVREPISGSAAQRLTEIIRHTEATIEEVRSIAPQQIVLIKATVYQVLAPALTAAGHTIANEGALPFPGSGHQERFRNGLQALIDSGRLKL